ncbi:ATP-binding protein [Thalassovita sp.]|uniref:ATP-binding protein n=1 Tax=Thalassovita sp. TaxID=1979401 RepID=UPI0028822C33|nr:ATP-binding protein [Thalassovita sp.]MDF1804010.1 ATP-binding protein [Thalassovita sp.]
MSSKNPPNQTRSIRSSIQRRLVPLIILAWLGTALATFVIAFVEVDEATIHNLHNLNNAAARVFNAEIDETRLPASMIEEEGEGEEFLLVIRDARGAVLHSSHPNLDLPEIAQDGPFAWGEWRLFKSHSTGGHVIISGIENEERDEIIGQIVLSASLPMLVVLGILLFAALWLVQKGLYPLKSLSNSLRQRAPETLAPLPETSQPTELQPIAHALNGLFARVQQFLSCERNFIDDAAHELRTPLTIIKAQCQAIDVEDLSDENRQRLGHVIEGVDRATALSTRLLAQARAERDGTTARTIDPTSIAKQAIAEIKLTQKQKIADVSLLSDDILIRTAPEDLQLILTNLLENAALHGGEQVEIKVEIFKSDGQAVIAIEDSGPGIPEAETSMIFERFYRGTDVKPSEEGSGLGLSIVRALAARNGMTVRVTSGHDLPGARFEVSAPLA